MFAVTKLAIGAYADGRRRITAILAEPRQEKQKQSLKAENDALRQRLAELEARLAQAAK
jgi:predicted aminopeptidase